MSRRRPLASRRQASPARRPSPKNHPSTRENKMPRAPKVRILVASGARARWVERVEGHDDLVTLGELEPRFVHIQHGPAGVSFESAAGGMRHGIGERSAETKRRTEDFAREIAASLSEQQARGEFDRLGLIAPPRMLRSI